MRVLGETEARKLLRTNKKVWQCQGKRGEWSLRIWQKRSKEEKMKETLLRKPEVPSYHLNGKGWEVGR